MLKNGKPVKPSLATLDVNLNGVVYSEFWLVTDIHEITALEPHTWLSTI
jgi:hypothetical protein